MANLLKRDDNLLSDDADALVSTAPQRQTLIIFAAIIAILGVSLLLRTRAAAPENLSIEPEQSTNMTGCLTPITNDPTASGGGAVKFDCAQPPAGGFVHPGIVLDKPQLDFVKGKLAEQTTTKNLWQRERDRALSKAKLDHVSHPVPALKCATDDAKAAANGYVQAGCSDIILDSEQAYLHALLWYYTRDPQYAKKSIEIIQSWSKTMTTMYLDQPRYADNNFQVYIDNQLFGGWGGIKFLKAAEILRYSYTDWPASQITELENHFKTVYYPIMKDGWTNGQNRTTTMNSISVLIGVFTNDRAIYDDAVAQSKYNNKVIMYLSSADGAQPVYPMYKGALNYIKTPTALKGAWFNPNSYIDGLSMETCRDLGHTMLGVSALTDVAETVRIQDANLPAAQKQDFYGSEQARYVATHERQADYILQYLANPNVNGTPNRAVTPTGWKPANNWVCPNFAGTAGGWSVMYGWEVPYSHYKAKGVSMPKTEELIKKVRAMGTNVPRSGNNVGWEILTSADQEL